MNVPRIIPIAILSCAGAVCSLLTGCNAPAPQPSTTREQLPSTRTVQRSTATGSFDYYLLTLSWSPEYCHSHRGAAQCQAHSTFVLHGLWPENSDGTYPENCSNTPLGNMPSPDPYPDPRLAQHEWQTHGTCTGMDPATYFQTAQRAFTSVKIPGQLQSLTQPLTLTGGQIVSLFTNANPGLDPSAVAVSCNNGYFSAVEVCMDKDLHTRACGSGVHSCSANNLRITPP